MKTAIISILSVALVGSVAGNFLLYQRYSSRRALVRMGDQVVTRKEYTDRIDHLYGKTVMNKIVYEKLIAAAAAKAGVAPTEKDIDARIADIERRNPQILEGAKRDPDLMADLRRDIAQDIGFEGLRMKDVTVSDAEVADFYAKNKGVFALPGQAQTTVVASGNDVDAATAKGLLEQGMKGEAIAHQPRLRVAGVGGFSLPPNLPAALRTQINQTVFHLKPGQIGTVPVGTGFLVIRLDSMNMPSVPPLEQVKPLATRLCKLQKAPAPDIVLARLFKDANVQFEVDKYAPYFNDIQTAAQRLNDIKAPAGKK